MHPRYRSNYRVLQSLRAARLRRAYVVGRVAARRALVGRALAGGAIGAGALAGYGAYRGSRALMRRRRRAVSRMKRRRIGYSPRKLMPCKCVHMGNQGSAAKAIGRIHSLELINIPRAGTLSASHKQRLHNHCIIKGFKIQKYFENIDTSNVQVTVNVAIVTTKVHEDTTGLNDGDAEWNDQFHRDTENDPRYKDFDQTTTSRNAIFVNTAPINPDRWIVHKRWRKTLEPANSPDAYKKTWRFNKYVPFNRQVVFDDIHDVPETGRTFLIYWFDYPSRGELTSAGTANVVNHMQVVATYFRDAKIS